jgi:hypothetical protein
MIDMDTNRGRRVTDKRLAKRLDCHIEFLEKELL